MIRLIPFNVEVRVPQRRVEGNGDIQKAQQRINAELLEDFGFLERKEWMVSGVSDGKFLLVRDGEITQWVTQGWCVVKG